MSGGWDRTPRAGGEGGQIEANPLKGEAGKRSLNSVTRYGGKRLQGTTDTGEDHLRVPFERRKKKKKREVNIKNPTRLESSNEPKGWGKCL